MAYEASPAVAVARVIPNSDPGSVSILIIPHGQEPRPQPSFGLRKQIRKFIEARAPADLSMAYQIKVIGPRYFPINVEATLAPIDPAETGMVERRVRESLEEFFHPLRGGPERRGWELGRDVFLSDVAAILERAEGVDYVETLVLSSPPSGAVPTEGVEVPDNQVVVAGSIRLKLKTAEQ
jgi:hypothetical protein